jgi:hypothetical protein
VLTVTKKKLWVIAGVIGAASVAAVPAISAQAYPPGTDMQVGVAPTGNPHEYVVSVTDADPTCIFRVVSASASAQTHVAPNGKASVTIDIGAKTGTRPLIAKTISCKSAKNKETYHTKIVTTTTQYKGPSTAKKGELITFKALGWNPDYPVVITISNDKGPVKSKTLKPNSSGNAFWKTKTPPVGTYAVTFTQQGAQPRWYTLVITAPKKKH